MRELSQKEKVDFCNFGIKVMKLKVGGMRTYGFGICALIAVKFENDTNALLSYQFVSRLLPTLFPELGKEIDKAFDKHNQGRERFYILYKKPYGYKGRELLLKRVLKHISK